jgi:uncharacterized FAD-dependent dehydrogenase
VAGRHNIILTPDELLDLPGSLRQRFPGGARVVRCALDARHRKVRFLLTVEEGPEVPGSGAEPIRRAKLHTGRSVVVVGAGPAGLFAALSLLERGVTPVVLDRGAAFPERHLAARDLRLKGELKAAPAMTCGLGGAGTYSDGKLHTRKRTADTTRVIDLLAWFARDPWLTVDTHPHIGSNRLPRAVQRIRDFIEAAGGRFFFRTEVDSLVLKGGRTIGVRIGTGEVVRGDAVVLAPGNSARGLFERLASQFVAVESKPLAVGVRVEHPRTVIDTIQLGAHAGHPACGAARYAFAVTAGGRGVYSFCMCPGGYVIPTPPDTGRLSLNGMSFATRSSAWSNAAVVVTVSSADWGTHSPLAGVAFQRSLEEACLAGGGGGFRAPAQRLTDFMKQRPSRSLPEVSYKPGVVPYEVFRLLPGFVADGIRAGVTQADRQMRGYLTSEAVVIGVETMTSSPVRFPRSPEMMSLSHPGLFPCGEGSGWAGGITSSAADGLAAGALASAWAVERPA